MTSTEARIAIDQAIADLEAMGLERPFGITLTPDYDQGGILVANEKLGFFISKNTISQGHHIAQYEPTLKRLCELLQTEDT